MAKMLSPDRQKIVKAARYDGSGSGSITKHNLTGAEINNWTNTEKGLYLAVALRGQAQSVMGYLSDRV